jgi:hypothetical protein
MAAYHTPSHICLARSTLIYATSKGPSHGRRVASSALSKRPTAAVKFDHRHPSLFLFVQLQAVINTHTVFHTPTGGKKILRWKKYCAAKRKMFEVVTFQKVTLLSLF